MATGKPPGGERAMTVSTKGVVASALALAIAMTPSHSSATIKVGDPAVAIAELESLLGRPLG